MYLDPLHFLDAEGLFGPLALESIYLGPLHFLEAEGLQAPKLWVRLNSIPSDKVLVNQVSINHCKL
jgi:hypothetical protein